MKICHRGWAMEPISNSDLERLRDTLAKHEVEYLLIGKMAAIV